MSTNTKLKGLYHPSFEKDSCGFGLIANIDDKPSHWLIKTSIAALGRLTHRGAVAADGKSGEGCGLLLKKPDSFLRAKAAELGINCAANYAVGLIFISPHAGETEISQAVFEEKIAEQGIQFAGWREVPTDPSACGEEALKSLPAIYHAYVNAPDDLSVSEFDRSLYLARRAIGKAHEALDNRRIEDYYYISSMASNVLSYKGLIMPKNLPVFYKNLNDETMESAICVFHQRFSTNTWPQWKLAQPFRYLAHNGEINTIQGNRNWANARAYKFKRELLPDVEAIKPLVNMSGSDSSSMDNMLDFLLTGGMDIFRAMRLLIPPAWQNVDHMDSALHAFYEYNSMHMEPWDGPAGIVLTEGRYACCVMDRNGLRPARWVLTKDQHITLGSEIGVWDYAPEDVIAKGRLKPGQMIAVDTETSKLLLSDDIDKMLQDRHPYEMWLRDRLKRLSSNSVNSLFSALAMDKETLTRLEKQFQVSFEERDQILKPLAQDSQEATGSMGDDTPLPVLSMHRRSLYDSFRQQFAQVTNPPIDPLREKIVMSLETCFGREHNLFHEKAEHANRMITSSPILSEQKYVDLLALHDEGYSNQTISLGYDPEKMVVDCLPAIKSSSGGDYEYAVKNVHRSIGARLSGEIARIHGNHGMEDNPITLHLKGTAGQSFGVWNAGGLNMCLEGDANDYVCKGMAGGKVVIKPPRNSHFKSQDSTIIGNTCLYGATGGKLLAAGLAGERFAVPNSGAGAIVEGVGDHGCEYMTDGIVTILGNTGINFGAGMTGGIAYVLDLDRSFIDRINNELIDIHRIVDGNMESHRVYLTHAIQEYVDETASEWGQYILENFSHFQRKIWMVKPKAAEFDSLLETLQRNAA